MEDTANTQQALINRLRNVNIKSIKPFSFDGVEVLALVANVHDPDTITAIFEWHGSMIKYNIRLVGVDAPELHSDNQAERDVCLAGIKVLDEMIEGKVVRLELGRNDKYGGRILGTAFTLDGVCVNKFLVDNHYARGYDGGRKGPWTPEELALAGTVSDVVEKGGGVS